eukprot:m.342909 g.342909  ORF g.342909 m.342909 type:complete len:160 (-) comp22012_c0_seq1:73-552(-)
MPEAPLLTAPSNVKGSRDNSEPCVGEACKDGTDTVAKKEKFAYMHSECPVNRRELGRCSWAYLHTLAAYYPNDPTKEMEERMRNFMLEYGRMYPCGYCADTTTQEMIRNPPRTQSRHEFSQWMCEIHNEVNDRLNKPKFDCSKVLERWRTGPPDGSCFR